MISVVTPSFNCATYIRQCIESVLVQDYENFEHIVIDGGSEDGTVEILKQYPHIKWISEPDKGEAEALNKALRMVRGDIIGWLNADDYYLENVFHKVAQEMDPQQRRHVIYGKTNIVDEEGKFLGLAIPISPVTLERLLRWFYGFQMFQPSIFYSNELVKEVGFFREDLYFSVDYDYWLRIVAKEYEFHFVEQVFANARLFRVNSKSKTQLSVQMRSWHSTSKSYLKFLSFGGRIKFWKEYYAYCFYHQTIMPLRARLRLRTRLKKTLQTVRWKVHGAL